jgi:hypothetical protein
MILRRPSSSISATSATVLSYAAELVIDGRKSEEPVN